MAFYWKDDSREELETRAPGDKRELMVHLFYPAAPNGNEPRAPYVPDADAMRGAWNEEQLARIISMLAFSRDKPPLPPGDARYPVIIFAPGGGMKGLIYHALLEDLASHGWVVAAIDPPHNARAVRVPDGRVLGNLRPAERTWPPTRDPVENRRFYLERIVHWARDVTFVIDQLTALDRGSGAFSGRLDLQRGVGVLGHSRGGQAAGAARVMDERVRGGINIDGTMEDAIMPVKGPGVVGIQPFLWIQGPPPPTPTEAQLQRAGRSRGEYETELKRILANWQRQLEAVNGGAMRLSFNRPEIAHIDFSDEPFWDGSMTPENRAGRLKTIADTRAWVRAFFDGSVRGEWEDLKKLAESAQPPQTNLTLHAFGSMWP
jgi:hypothetical protein